MPQPFLLQVNEGLAVLCLIAILYMIIFRSAQSQTSRTNFEDDSGEKVAMEPYEFLRQAYQLLLPAYLKSWNQIRCSLELPQDKANSLAQQYSPLETRLNRVLEQQLALDEQQVREILVCFHKSRLAQDFKQELLQRLTIAQLDKQQAQTLAERVAWGTHRYIIEAFASGGDDVQPLAELYGDGWHQEKEKYDRIAQYLNNIIAHLPNQRVFADSFSHQVIYVKLKARNVEANGQLGQEDVLENLVMNWLNNPAQQNDVMFIKGRLGGGKSVFCLMFAERVRRESYPTWTPIFIRLRDVASWEGDFADNLRKAVRTETGDADFTTTDENHSWLKNPNTRFLFLLDGFDELRAGRDSQVLKRFFEDVAKFQRDRQHQNPVGHRFLITGRKLPLQDINLPENLRQLEIQTMNEELLKELFNKLQLQISQVNPDAALAFEQFFNGSRRPESLQYPRPVKVLLTEPMLLYVLARMYRERTLNGNSFDDTNRDRSEVKIYQQLLRWVLKEQRPHRSNEKLTELETSDLELILKEAAVCVFQSKQVCVQTTLLAQRLQDLEQHLQERQYAAFDRLKQARKLLQGDFLKIALATFYIAPCDSADPSFKFVHQCFYDFLCAEKLKTSLETWTKRINPGQGEQKFEITKAQMHWELYDLLGYNNLTPQIVKYLMTLLEQSQDFHPVLLFKRLQTFYLCWCYRKFPPKLSRKHPQSKRTMEDLENQVQSIQQNEPQKDIYVLLNVLILLLELHRRYAQSEEVNLRGRIAFSPCGQNSPKDFRKKTPVQLGHIIEISKNARSRLLEIIKHINIVFNSEKAFARIVGPFLGSVKLNEADLSSIRSNEADGFAIDLSGQDVDLTEADLKDANLKGINLSFAKLNKAFLNSADLSAEDLKISDENPAPEKRANLTGADLKGANLNDANLSYANLSNAILTDAYLGGANLSNADLSGANLSNAVLCSADFSNANLTGTIFTGANVIGANFSNVSYNQPPQQPDIEHPEDVRNVPDLLKIQWGIG